MNNTEVLEKDEDKFLEKIISLTSEDSNSFHKNDYSGEDFVSYSKICNFVKWLSSDNSIDYIEQDIINTGKQVWCNKELGLPKGHFHFLAVDKTNLNIVELEATLKTYNSNYPEMQLPLIYTYVEEESQEDEFEDATVMFNTLPESERQNIPGQRLVSLEVVANFLKWLHPDNPIDDIIKEIMSSVQTELIEEQVVLSAGVFTMLAIDKTEVGVYKLDSLIKDYNEQNPQMQLPVIFIDSNE